jgi:alpha-1,2-mannosyltransferase
MARILPSLLKPTSTRNRLWQAGAALAIFILTMAIGNIFSPPGKAVTTDMLGLDFLPFYASGAMARTGRTDLLYDIPAVAAFEHETAKSVGLNLGDAFGPFWNPPFYAWVFAPLSMLPYRQALAVWTLINVAALGV